MRHWQKNPHTEIMEMGVSKPLLPLSLGDGQPPRLAEFQPHLNSFPMPLATKLEIENEQLKVQLAQAQVKAQPFNIFDPLNLFVQPAPRKQLQQTPAQPTLPKILFKDSDESRQIISTV